MHFLANVVLLAANCLLLVMALQARPMRPESFVGFHLVTAPIALGQAIGLAIGIWTSRDAQTLPAWLLLAALPGHALALTVLPMLAYGVRGRSLYRTAIVFTVLGSELTVNGAALPPICASLGGAVLLMTGCCAYAIAFAAWAHGVGRRLRARLAHRPGLDGFDVEQAKWQFEAWQKVPADAGLAELLGFSRAAHAGVKAECLARLAALPDLDERMSELLATDLAGEAMHYIVHDYPHSRAPLAPAIEAQIERAGSVFAERQREGCPDRDRLDDAFGYLEGAVAVLRDGGDVRAALQQWHELVRDVPALRGFAKELAGHLRRGVVRPAR